MAIPKDGTQGGYRSVPGADHGKIDLFQVNAHVFSLSLRNGIGSSESAKRGICSARVERTVPTTLVDSQEWWLLYRMLGDLAPHIIIAVPAVPEFEA